METMIRMQSYVTHWLIASRQYINYSKNPKGHPMNMVKAGNVTEGGLSLVFKGLLYFDGFLR